MRIGMILDRPFPPDHRVEKEAKSLIAAGHEVHLFCFKHDRHILSDEIINKIHVHRFYMAKEVFKKLSATINVFPFYNRFWKKRLTEVIPKFHIDVLHIHDLPLSKIALQLRKQFRIPVIIDMHENYADWIEETPHYNTPIGIIIKKMSRWKIYEKKCLQYADYVIGVSPILIKKMVEEYDLPEQKIIFVPNTPDPDFMKLEKIDEDIRVKMTGRFNLIFVGGIAYLRGLQNVIPQMIELKKRIPEVQLVIVGDGTYLPNLKALVKELHLEDVVTFCGWESIPRVAAYISLSQTGLYPPLKYHGVDDKVPTKMFQYWALGKPIIASNHQLPREMIKKYEAGFTVDFENDSQKFIEVVLKLYQEESLRIKMGQNGLRAIQEEWNWEKTVRSLIELYEKLDAQDRQSKKEEC